MRLRSMKNRTMIMLAFFLTYLGADINCSRVAHRVRISFSQEASFGGSVISVSLRSAMRAS
jgi:hypothetical protein